MILRQRQSCTFVGGHEVLSLVFAVVEAAGEDQVIVVTLEEDSVRGATGQEGAPCGGGTGILCFWGLGQGYIPESLHTQSGPAWSSLAVLRVIYGTGNFHSWALMVAAHLQLSRLSDLPLGPPSWRPCSEGWLWVLSAGGLTSWPVMSSLRKAMDSSSLPRLVRARRQVSRLSNLRSRNSMDFRAFSCTTRA